VAQNTAQAAVWHAGNGLSWDQLAGKDRVRLSNGYTEKYFSPYELAAAMQVTGEAARRAEKAKSMESQKSDSLSRE
jgi:hypothetical protein